MAGHTNTPSTTLKNFAVSTDANGPAGALLMPKLKYRFRAIFTNFGSDASLLTELTKQIKDIKRPSVNFNPVTLDVYNSKIYIPGKPEWQEVTVALRDDVAGRIGKAVGQQMQKQFDFYEQASAVSATDYKFTMAFEMLDGGNGNYGVNVLESWQLLGCFISQADYGDMNYSANEEAMITLTIRYDNAVQLDSNGAAAYIPDLSTRTGIDQKGTFIATN